MDTSTHLDGSDLGSGYHSINGQNEPETGETVPVGGAEGTSVDRPRLHDLVVLLKVEKTSGRPLSRDLFTEHIAQEVFNDHLSHPPANLELLNEYECVIECYQVNLLLPLQEIYNL